jgi:ATP-dependent protease ClpP protease subunit
MQHFRDIYTRETRIPEKRLNKLLKRDIFMDSKKCLKYDIVDSIW